MPKPRHPSRVFQRFIRLCLCHRLNVFRTWNRNRYGRYGLVEGSLHPAPNGLGCIKNPYSLDTPLATRYDPPIEKLNQANLTLGIFTYNYSAVKQHSETLQQWKN